MKKFFVLFTLLASFCFINTSFSMEAESKIILKNNTLRPAGLILPGHGYSLYFTVNLRSPQKIIFPHTESQDRKTLNFTLIPDQELQTGIELRNIASIQVETSGGYRVAKASLQIQANEIFKKIGASSLSGKDVELIFNIETSGIAYVTKAAKIVFSVKLIDSKKGQEEEEEVEAEEIKIQDKDPYLALENGAKAKQLWQAGKKREAALLILGLTDPTDQNTAQRNRRKLIVKWHPDRHKGSEDIATEVTKIITEAYYTLYPQEANLEK